MSKVHELKASYYRLIRSQDSVGVASDIHFNILHIRTICYDILCTSLTNGHAVQRWMGEDTREAIDHQSTFRIPIYCQGVCAETVCSHTSFVMFTLPSCDGSRYSRSDDQFATLVAKMPEGELSVSDIPTLRRKVSNVTHELHPGEMHCDIGNIKVQLNLLVLSCPTHRYKVAPGNLFAGRVARWHRRHPLRPTKKTVGELTRAELPALLLDQVLQFRRAVT